MLKQPDVNTAEILRLAERMENLPAGEYDQKHWSIPYRCQTPGCICGHWHAMNGSQNFSDTVTASQAMGLNETQAFALFCAAPFGFLNSLEVRDPTPKQAAKVLRHLAVTGEVNWFIAKELKS